MTKPSLAVTLKATRRCTLPLPSPHSLPRGHSALLPGPVALLVGAAPQLAPHTGSHGASAPLPRGAGGSSRPQLTHDPAPSELGLEGPPGRWLLNTPSVQLFPQPGLQAAPLSRSSFLPCFIHPGIWTGVCARAPVLTCCSVPEHSVPGKSECMAAARGGRTSSNRVGCAQKRAFQAGAPEEPSLAPSRAPEDSRRPVLPSLVLTELRSKKRSPDSAAPREE